MTILARATLATTAMPLLALAAAACGSPPVVTPDASPPGFPLSAETQRGGRAGTIQVIVVHPDGSPVPGAAVRLLALVDGNARRRGAAEATDGLGRAVLTAEEPGTYRVALEDLPDVAFGWLRRGNDCAHAATVRIVDGERIGHGVCIVAPRGGALEVHVSRAGLADDDRVSVTLRRRYPSGDLLSRHGSNTRPDPFHDAARRTENWLWEELPEGRYVARVSVPERRTSRLVEVDVAAGRTSTVDVEPGPPGAPVVIAYEGSREGGEGQQVWLNATDGGADLVRGMLDDAPLRSLGAAPGRYVAILPRQDAAMVVHVPEVQLGEQVRVHLDPPAWTVPVEGGVHVTVRVLRDGQRLAGVFSGLAPPAADHLRSASWMRAESHRLEGVPPGDWDVIVLNGVYTDYAGLPASLVRRVRVEDDDLVVTVRVPAP